MELNKLQRAKILASRLAENETVPPRERKYFRAIAYLLSEYENDPTATPHEEGGWTPGSFDLHPGAAEFRRGVPLMYLSD